jgi:hypothetical protein
MNQSLPILPFFSRAAIAGLAVGVGAMSSSCGKFGYDSSGLEGEDAGTGNVMADGGSGSRAAFAVGSFVKSTTSGAQIVPHGLGRMPKALVLWTAGKPAAAPSADYNYALGVSDGPGSSLSLANASRSGATPSNSSRRMASRAFTVVAWGESTSAEADLSSWDAASFTLAWTTNDAAPYVIHYIAVGGDGVSAKVVPWQAPTSPGVEPIGRVGFQPDTVLHFYAGALFSSAPPSSQSNGALGMGLLDAAGHECAYQIAVVDAKSPTITAHALRTDASIYMFSELPAPPSVTKQASFASMDSGGYTLDFTTAETPASQVFSLALGGVRAKVASFDKATAARDVQSVTGIGFEPALVFLASVGDVSQSSGVSQPHGIFTTGASDGKNHASTAISDADDVTPSVASGFDDDTSSIFTRLSVMSATIEAQASLASFDRDGFSLRWTIDDSAPARICYWALGSP